MAATAEIRALARDYAKALQGPRPRDWDLIRTIQNRLSSISDEVHEAEHVDIGVKIMAVIDDMPRTASEIADLVNAQLRELADTRAEVRLALGASVAWTFAEVVTTDDVSKALRALRRQGFVRRKGIFPRWKRS